MKTKNLLTIAMMAFVAVNFIGCDDDDDETLQEKAERLKGSCSYSIDGITISDTTSIIEINSTKTYINTRNISDDNYEVSYDLYLGTSVDNMGLIDPQKINTEYFNMYYAQIIEYVTSNNERYDMDTIGVFKLLCMPYGQLYYETLFGAGGDNEFSNSIKMNLYHYRNNYPADEYLCYLNANCSFELLLTPGGINGYGNFYAIDSIEKKSYTISNYENSILLKGGRYPYADLPAYIVGPNGGVKSIFYKCEANNFKFIIGNDTIERQVIRDSTPYLLRGERYFLMCDTTNYVYGYGYGDGSYDGKDYGLNYLLRNKIHIGQKVIVKCKVSYIDEKLRNNYREVTDEDMLEIEQSYGIEKGNLSDYYINDLSSFNYTKMRTELENSGYVMGINTNLVADVYSLLESRKWDTDGNDAINMCLGDVELDGERYTAYRVIWQDMPGFVRVLTKGSDVSDYSIQK